MMRPAGIWQRRAGVDDAAVLADLYAACGLEDADAWGAAAIAGLLRLPGVFAVLAGIPANVAGPPAPASGLVIGRVAGGEAEILALGVTPEARRRGLGRSLVQAAVVQAAAAGAEAVYLEVAAGNRPARALYRALGFVRVGRRLGYYPADRTGDVRRDALVLRRVLAPPAGPTGDAATDAG